MTTNLAAQQAIHGITDRYSAEDLAEIILAALAIAYTAPEINGETIERVLAELINGIDNACDYFPDSDETDEWLTIADELI